MLGLHVFLGVKLRSSGLAIKVGLLASDARDVGLLLAAIAGHDLRDSTCVDEPVPDYLAELEPLQMPLRVGVPAEYFGEGLDAQVRDKVAAAIEALKRPLVVPVR